MCSPCLMDEKAETQRHHRLPWELPRQSCMQQDQEFCTRASKASSNSWSHVEATISQLQNQPTAESKTCFVSSGVAATEMMSVSINPVPLDSLTKPYSFSVISTASFKGKSVTLKRVLIAADLYASCVRAADTVSLNQVKKTEWKGHFQVHAKVIFRPWNKLVWPQLPQA